MDKEKDKSIIGLNAEITLDEWRKEKWMKIIKKLWPKPCVLWKYKIENFDNVYNDFSWKINYGKIKNIEEALAIFEDCAIKRGFAIDEGCYKKA